MKREKREIFTTKGTKVTKEKDKGKRKRDTDYTDCSD